MIAMEALYDFFSRFGIPAYAENTVPKEAELPYLTYPQKEPEWNKQTSFYVNVYYRHNTSNRECLTKADEIIEAVGEGVRIPFSGGLLILWPDTPMVQVMEPENGVRRAYINLAINSYHMPGA